MGVHSAQLGVSNTVPATGSTLYTVPAGKRTIVKSIRLANHNAASQRCRVQIINGGTTKYSFGFTLQASATDGDQVDDQTWMVLNVGDSVFILPALSTVGAMVSGTELDL